MTTKWLKAIVSAMAIAGGLWAFYSMSFWASRGGEGAPLYSVRRYDPYGTAALFELLKQRGMHVRTLEQSRPDRSHRGVIVQVLETPSAQSDLFGPPPQLQTQTLKNWIAQGHTVIQLTAARTDLMDACGVPTGDSIQDPELWREIQKAIGKGTPPDKLPGDTARIQWLGHETNRYPPPSLPVVLRSPTPLPNLATGLWQPLARHDQQTVIGMQRVGAGRLIVISSPTPVLNGSIGDGGNLDMILGLIGRGPVLIDEWSHGIGHGGTIVGIMKSLGVMPTVFQVGFVLILYVWSTLGHRRTDAVRPARKRSSVEQVATLGYLYHQSLPPNEINQRVNSEVSRRLASVLRCRPSDISEKAAALTGTSEAEKILAILPTDPRATGALCPICPRCGYSLVGNQSGACPDCGTAIPPRLRRQVVTAGHRHTATVDQSKTHHTETSAARRLALSHQLVRELNRERSKQTGAGKNSAGAGRSA